MGPDLAILAHHYEADDVVRHADILGDSLELARQIQGLNAEHIVFCGVHFMAETAAILARPNQKIHIPDPSAGCVMANMVPAGLAENVVKQLQSDGKRIIPLTYVNSSAAVKAICGQYGGSVCTSANAATMLSWALNQGDGVLFLPDANLGHNTAKNIGLDPDHIVRLNIQQNGALVTAATKDVRLYLWPGLCAVHAKFKPEQIMAIRQADPKAQILVHPECAPAVVNLADSTGSTSFLIKKTAQLPAGSHIYIGTEWNLVNRLAQQYPDKFIRPLRTALCSNMAKTTADNLAHTLNSLDTAVPVRVSENLALPARQALERMLSACR